MKALLLRFFQAEPIPQPLTGLEKIRRLSRNLQHIPANLGHAEHFIAQGIIKVGDQVPQAVRTAVRSRGLKAEFSTNVGQVPNDIIGRTVPECLNHRIPGKLVTFPSEESRTRELVYVTEQPADYLDTTRFVLELETHAMTKAAVIDILSGLNQLGSPRPGLDVNNMFDSIQQFVDSRLNVRQTLESVFLQSDISPLNR